MKRMNIRKLWQEKMFGFQDGFVEDGLDTYVGVEEARVDSILGWTVSRLSTSLFVVLHVRS